MLEESFKLLQSKTLVEVDEVLVLDRHSMIVVFGFTDYIAIHGGTSVDHDLEFESVVVAFRHIKILKETEDKARHKVKAQDSIKLLLRLNVITAYKNRIDTKFERM